MSSTETQEKSITSNLTSQITNARFFGHFEIRLTAEAALSFSKVKILQQSY
jgi:hypothetical protein